MKSNFLGTIPKLALAAVFAAATGSSVIATQAANPSETASNANLFADTAIPASAQPYHERWHDGYVDAGWRGGYWHGRRYQHRRWHGGYWGPFHHWHPGFWVYF
jgi:hypothetical protein